jgi:hypothetical protein
VDDMFPGPHARSGDPDTSHLAVPDRVKMTQQAIAVLRSYRTNKALLDFEAYARANMIGHQRCSDLRHANFIERCGRRPMPSGKAGYTCQITSAGRAFLELFEQPNE